MYILRRDETSYSPGAENLASAGFKERLWRSELVTTFGASRNFPEHQPRNHKLGLRCCLVNSEAKAMAAIICTYLSCYSSE